MPELHNREKVLVQYRLLKDFDDLRRRGIPGIDVRVMEDNIYEWHVTMSPISGHFSGLRIHMVLLLPEDYPRKPPKVELYNFLPHANVFRDFLQSTSLAWASYWRGSSPARGKYVLCTDLLEMKPPPLDPNDSRRHEGWSPSYSVEAVLVQLQCLLFDDYVHSDHGQHINTLWDTWYARPGQGRKSRQQVCAELHQAQLDADAFYCPACGYWGRDDSVAFYDSPEAIKSSDEESESEAEQCEEQKGTKREHTFVSRKKQKKRELEKLKVATKDPKVDFKQQRLYMEIANSNSALRSGHALRRVPGVFRVRDVVSFRFHGVPDEVYLNGQLCINRDLQIFNYGHEVEYPWRWYDPMLGRFVYRQQQPPEEEEEEKKTGKVVWERFVNSQNGGGKLKAEDTPGTEAFVKKREQFYAVGVVESVNPHTCTVSIVIVENDATMGSATAPLTNKWGEWAFNSEQHSSGLKATLYKNIPMEKACLHGYEGFVAPYDHPPPAVYKPVPGHYTAEEFLAYDVTKDSPVELLKLLENGEEVEGLTRQKLAWLPERPLLQKEAPSSEQSSVLEGWEVLGDGSSLEGSELELWSLCESDSWDLVSRASQSNRSFEVVSVVSEQSGSLSHSFHVVPSGLSALSSSLGSYDLVPSQAPSQAGSVASRISAASERSLLTLRSAHLAPENFPEDRGHPGSWQLLSVLCKLNVPLRGTVRSLQDFGAFVSLDATPRDLAVQHKKLVSGGRLPKGKGKSKGKGKGKSDGETKMLQDGLLPCLPYMRPSWPPRSSGEQGSNRDSSVMVNGNVFEQMGRQTLGPAEVVVYISEVDVNQRRMKLSLQPRLTFEELRIGGKHEGIVVDTSHLGLFVALSDSLVGLLPRAQLGVGAFAEGPEEDGWYRRSVYKRGDIVTVWVLRKALADANSRRKYKIDLTMDKYNEELSGHFLRSSLRVLDAGASGRQPGGEDPKVGKTAMDLQFEETYDAEDKFFLIKNNRLIKDAMSQYPELVIDYTTDPPPPQETTKTKSFDFSLIEGWSVQKITEEHKRLCDKQLKFEEKAQGAKPLSKEEERLLTVLKKKVEQWGNEYYENVCKKIERHQKFIEDIHRKIKEERDKYPYKSIIDLDKFRELSQRIAEKGYHERCCFVTRLCYKEDVLGVGLEIVNESDTGRKIFQCSFDLLSKEAFKDFGIRSGVWKEKVEFWLPLAIDARHFRRALPYLAECFRQLGDGRVEAATRSYGTQAGNGVKSLRANLRELQRTGQKMVSLEEYKKQKAQPEKEKAKPEEGKPQPAGLRPAASLTEADVAYGLEVLPKLMNLQTVQLMKGDLHLSTKALEGYMGFHHLLLSILRQYPSLQAQVESKIGTFVRSEAGRTKQSCPNLGEFLCLLAVSKKYTWDDVSAAVLKETLDRNASWALDKYPSLAGFGTSAENRLERTFKASIVSIRLLCFNVWFLRNVVFKRYGAQATSAEILEAEQRGGPGVSCTDMRWAEYEEQKGIPRPEEINMLQEQMRRTLHGNGLNSWSEYFVNLNLQPLKADELSQLLVMSLHDSVRKGYIPLWKMRMLQQKNQQDKAPKTNDYLGADMDKYDSMHTEKGGSGHRW